MSRRLPLIAAVVAGAAIIVGAAVRHLLADPAVVLLLPDRGARWIRADRPFDLLANFGRPAYAAFETTVVVPAAAHSAPPAVLEVASLSRVIVSVDGRRIWDGGWDVPDWHEVHAVRLPVLPPGRHTLRLEAGNRGGPAVVRARCPVLGVATGPDGWRATDTAGDARPASRWAPAVRADAPWEPPLAERFEPADRAVVRLAPLLLGWIAVGIVGQRAAARLGRGRAVDWGRWVGWAVLLAWAGLAGNNLFRVPADVGYDVGAHVDYVRMVAETFRPPLPDQGWETFHPPVYYFCSAVLYRLALAMGATVPTATTLLRLVPLACGAAMVELCYRAARATFPGRSDLHAVAAVVGGLLPMNLYMGQAVSNEPLAACLDGILTLACLDLLRSPGVSPRRWAARLVVLGGLLGLTILTKLSGLVWAGPVTVAVAVAGARRRRPARGGVVFPVAPAVVVGVTAAVCGWYFVRNQLALGVPFLSHSRVGQSRWWQDPGYRTPANFLTFGRSLACPVYGDLTSVWDDLYATLWSDGMLNGLGGYAGRPPWHYGLMACGLWLAVPPTIALLVGVGRGLGGRVPGATGDGLRFAVGTLGLFVLALVYLCLTWPIYSCVKASYLLGVTPCMAVLAAAGFDRLAVGRWGRAIAVGLLTCWAATAYGTYVVSG